MRSLSLYHIQHACYLAFRSELLRNKRSIWFKKNSHMVDSELDDKLLKRRCSLVEDVEGVRFVRVAVP
jgi:hypothetical protein